MRSVLALILVLAAFAGAAEDRRPNRLAGAASPYLLQHVYNPVDWFPWGAEALEKARVENKPIFVSVGYSSCHWCHVMAEESFENEAIAEILNDHFVSIKIDRESRPDLDEQFMLATELLTVGGGWPNSVFLTPDGDPFHAGGYFPPDQFHDLVDQLWRAWRDDARFLEREAAKVAASVHRYLTQGADAFDVTEAVARGAAAALIADMDEFFGGYGVAPKFPREAIFLFLLDHAERTGDRAALGAVTAMLDGMILGGVHDHVGGGFHRYAVDPEWRIPHFEKMLYTQALTGRLLLRVGDISGAPRMRRAAERTLDYVLRTLRDPAGGFYAAEGADSLSADGETREGAFYTWTPADFDALGGAAAVAREVFEVEADGEFEGANILHLSEPVADLAIAADRSSAETQAELDGILAALRSIRARRPPPFLDRKIVLAWNGLMIATLAEAGDLLARPDYTAAAEAAGRFILAKMDGTSGLRRLWYEGAAHTQAQLPDYAALGLALIALHDHAPSGNARWLAEARRIAAEILTRFGPAEGGLRMTQTRDGMTDIIAVDDADIPSGNALALSFFARLARRAPVPEVERAAHSIAAAIGGLAAETPATRAFALKAARELLDGDAGRRQRAAKGAVRVDWRRGPEQDALTAAISLAEGWHIYGPKSDDGYTIATRLIVDGLPDPAAVYPATVTRTLSFDGRAVALYEGDIEITTRLVAGARRATLAFQACSDDICLQPESLGFTLW